MSNLIKHAEVELKLSGLLDKDSDYNGMLGTATLELIKTFSNQGHSGASASMVSNLFDKLSRYKPLCPLTFKDEEWGEVSNESFQNKRNSAVFKDGKGGKPYYINAFTKIAIFPDGHKSGWNGSLELGDNKYVSRCYIKDSANIPTVNIELKAYYYGDKGSDWEFELAKESQLDELKKHYDFDILTHQPH